MANWDDITTDNIARAVALLTCEGDYDSADVQRVKSMFDIMKQRDIENVNLNYILNQLSEWRSMDSLEQVNLAVEIAGMYNASYFIAFMDVLNVLKEEKDGVAQRGY